MAMFLRKLQQEDEAPANDQFGPSVQTIVPLIQTVQSKKDYCISLHEQKERAIISFNERIEKAHEEWQAAIREAYGLMNELCGDGPDTEHLDCEE